MAKVCCVNINGDGISYPIIEFGSTLNTKIFGNPSIVKTIRDVVIQNE